MPETTVLGSALATANPASVGDDVTQQVIRCELDSLLCRRANDLGGVATSDEAEGHARAEGTSGTAIDTGGDRGHGVTVNIKALGRVGPDNGELLLTRRVPIPDSVRR